jgi:NADH-quinone oxidoreductase subunit G
MSDKSDTVTLTIDDREVTVPKGTNLIEVAESVGIEIPHYCYHRHLSIAGNCRMCQVAVEGMPKLTIACNTTAAEGMVVRTHHTSEEVADAQRATLEFLLINHPLDCTVCDQSGHCKLQDYYHQYNSKASRFIEEKVHKVKAEVLGPEIVYDGERCILCTRCVRFCDEVTRTSELGVFNRGDHSVIGVHKGTALDNPLSATVADLCPVGALTHRRWRFNSRIWYTSAVETVCAGCSTGCNAEVSVRDNQVLHVKARRNSDVNQEWMCDEGRYGFMRFQPMDRLYSALELVGQEYRSLSGEEVLGKTVQALKSQKGSNSTAVFLSPLLTLEELWLSVLFCEKALWTPVSSEGVAMQLRHRELSKSQQVLVSPDYSANARAGTLFGLVEHGADWHEALDRKYQTLLSKLREGAFQTVVMIGDCSILNRDLDSSTIDALRQALVSIQLGTRFTRGSAGDDLAQGTPPVASLVIPVRTINEKQGVLVNRDLRFQRVRQFLDAPTGVDPEWRWLLRIAKELGKPLLSQDCQNERALYRMMSKDIKNLEDVSLVSMGSLGFSPLDANGSGNGG